MTEAQTLRDHVRVHNDGDSDILVQFNSQPFLIPAGQAGLLPREAACKDFGNWDARGDDREREYRRLRGLYGALDGMAGDTERFNSNRPKVRIFETDGEQVVTVMEDPIGKGLPVVGQPLDETQAIIAEMRREIDELKNGREPESHAALAVPDDTPETAPRRVRKTAPITLPRE